jgi:hypothetical protein
VQEVIQEGSGVEPVHPIDNLLTVQAPRHRGIVTVGYLRTPSFCQAPGHLLLCLLHNLLPAVVSEYPSAIEEWGPPIKALACRCLGALADHDTYVGISETSHVPDPAEALRAKDHLFFQIDAAA